MIGKSDDISAALRIRSNFIIDIKGDIGVESLLSIRKCLEDQLAKSTKHIALNFKDVRSIESSGIGLLINFHKKLASIGRKLCFFNVSQENMSQFNDTSGAKVLRIVEGESQLKDVFVQE